MLLSAIVMIAFTVSASAQNKMDHVICDVASIDFATGLENNSYTPEMIKLMKQAYYKGCIDERNCHKEEKQKHSITR